MFGSPGPLDKVTYRLKSNDEKCSVLGRGKFKGYETAVNLAFFLFPEHSSWLKDGQPHGEDQRCSWAGKVSSRQVLCSLVNYPTSSWRRQMAEKIQLEGTGGFPGGSVGKESAYSAGNLSSIPGLGRSPGEGNGTHSSIPAWEIL